MEKLKEYYRYWKDGDHDHVSYRGRPWNNEPFVDIHAKPQFDPMLGFTKERKPREMKYTLDEMDALGIPKHHRNYCTHKYVEYLNCAKTTPHWRKAVFNECQHNFHDYKGCVYEQDILQAKEFEREKRLLARHQRRIAMGLEEGPETAAM